MRKSKESIQIDKFKEICKEQCPWWNITCYKRGKNDEFTGCPQYFNFVHYGKFMSTKDFFQYYEATPQKIMTHTLKSAQNVSYYDIWN